jgi:hypothetical protein
MSKVVRVSEKAFEIVEASAVGFKTFAEALDEILTKAGLLAAEKTDEARETKEES